MLSIIRPRFDVENSGVRRKTFGNDLILLDLGPSGPKKITVGWVILTVPRRNKVNQAVIAEIARASAEIRSASTEKTSELVPLVSDIDLQI
jgi:hypothetical protein